MFLERLPKMQDNKEEFFYRRGNIGALLLHGFTGTPEEFGNLGRYLANKNITCYCPILPGHPSNLKRLKIIKKDEWISKINKEINFIKKYCRWIFIIGSSFGGNLAFSTANKHKEVAGIITLSTPMKFKKWNIFKKLLIIALENKKLKKTKQLKSQSELRDIKKYFDYTNLSFRKY